jgi:hypothetical protein
MLAGNRHNVGAAGLTAVGRRQLGALRTWLWVAVGVVSMVVGLPPLIAHVVSPVEFNQRLIERLESSRGVESLSEAGTGFRRSWTVGARILLGRTTHRAPAFESERELVGYVFSWLPSKATVYPTEGFYYYKFRTGDGREVWGNLRVAELDAGRLGFAYFRPDEREQLRYDNLVHGRDITVNRLGEFRWLVTMNGRTVEFVVPAARQARVAACKLLAEEELVGPVFDESGTRLSLLFNKRLNAFYFVLDARAGLTESLRSVSPGVLLGSRTGFAYFDDTRLDRRLLIGVHLENVKANNYFDGPGDQVPYWVSLRNQLHLAYPHTMKGAGIDEHGVAQGTSEWARIAVSPFIRYASLDELKERVEQEGGHTDPGVRCVALTKEWWNSPQWLAGVISDLHAEGKKLAGVPTCGMAIPTMPGPDGAPLSVEEALRLAPLGPRVSVVPNIDVPPADVPVPTGDH